MGGAATTRCRSGRWRPSAPSSAAESPRHSPDAESPRKLFDPLREASIGSPAPNSTNAAASRADASLRVMPRDEREPESDPGLPAQQRLTRVLPRGFLAGSACPRAGHFSFDSLA